MRLDTIQLIQLRALLANALVFIAITAVQHRLPARFSTTAEST
ncbi:hypothetical protein [Burkholderia stagnalis]|nr:hypothetical protein [Burkholderia stagnalis]